MARGTMANDYGVSTSRSSRWIRPVLAANHALHWISSIIVLGIAAYFIARSTHNAHIIYWIVVAAIDAFLYIPAIVLPFMKSYKGYLAPLAWIFSYLWLTAFIFAAQDYNYGCSVHSPPFFSSCSVKKTLEAFAFIAFVTNLIALLLETRLWDSQRTGIEKHGHGAGTTYPEAVAGTTT